MCVWELREFFPMEALCYYFPAVGQAQIFASVFLIDAAMIPS